ncbi:MAG: PEP-CTERM sorting domain-containing protein [Bryobacterales bacterium]|nr:PEP-CTERM sorting domain-containing protein [Bryobacterales bacterium]
MTHRPLLSLSAALLALLALHPALHAGPLTVSNHSFESVALASPGVGTATGWTPTGTGGVFRPIVGTHVNSIPDGLQVGYIFGSGQMIQNLGVAVQLGVTYQLDVYVGTQINFAGASYLIELLDGGSNVIASASGTRQQTDPFVQITASGIGVGTGNVRVRLSSTGGQPLFDNVRVQTLDPSPGVPEPSTLAFATLGLAAAFAASRHRRIR